MKRSKEDFMRIRIALACITLLLCASVAGADDPRTLRLQATYNNGMAACIGARIVVDGKTYTVLGSPVEVGPTLAPFVTGSTLSASVMWIESGSCSGPTREAGKGSVTLKHGAAGSIATNAGSVGQATVSYKVELQSGPIPSMKKWLITFSIYPDTGKDVIVGRKS
jgi:hypothetical protein